MYLQPNTYHCIFRNPWALNLVLGSPRLRLLPACSWNQAAFFSGKRKLRARSQVFPSSKFSKTLISDRERWHREWGPQDTRQRTQTYRACCCWIYLTQLANNTTDFLHKVNIKLENICSKSEMLQIVSKYSQKKLNRIFREKNGGCFAWSRTLSLLGFEALIHWVGFKSLHHATLGPVSGSWFHPYNEPQP